MSDREAEWVRWVDYTSPNARVSWLSYFPTLLRECIWFDLTVFDVRVNLRSLMWGTGLNTTPLCGASWHGDDSFYM